MTEAEVARWILYGIAVGALVWGLWWFLKREPPGRETVFSPMGRR